MATIEKAIEIAAKSHAGVRDKQGDPYVLHPLRVMLGVEGEAARIVAILHDVVEDTDVSLADLQEAQFSHEVIEALECVTHRRDQTYYEYVIACKRNSIAKEVKLSDLRDNANLSRLLLRPEKLDDDLQRLQRYVLSYRFLSDQIGEDQYRSLMMRSDVRP